METVASFQTYFLHRKALWRHLHITVLLALLMLVMTMQHSPSTSTGIDRMPIILAK